MVDGEDGAIFYRNFNGIAAHRCTLGKGGVDSPLLSGGTILADRV